MNSMNKMKIKDKSIDNQVGLMILSTLSNETRLISSLTAEMNIFMISKSTLRQAIKRIDLSISLMSNCLLIPTRHNEKISKTPFKIIIRQFSMKRPIYLHSKMCLHDLFILFLLRTSSPFIRHFMILALRMHSCLVTSLLESMMKRLTLQATVKQIARKANKKSCSPIFLREQIEQAQEHMMKMSEDSVQFKFMVMLRSIAVMSPLMRFKYSQFRED